MDQCLAEANLPATHRAACWFRHSHFFSTCSHMCIVLQTCWGVTVHRKIIMSQWKNGTMSFTISCWCVVKDSFNYGISCNCIVWEGRLSNPHQKEQSSLSLSAIGGLFFQLICKHAASNNVTSNCKFDHRQGYDINTKKKCSVGNTVAQHVDVKRFMFVPLWLSLKF